jgi:hypothetical protein
MGGIWKSLVKQDRESLQCCKQSLMSNSGGSSEDDNVDRNEDTEGQAHEISNYNMNFILNWTRGHSCYILAKNLSTLCLCPENLS